MSATPLYLEGQFPTTPEYWRAGHTLNFEPTTRTLYAFGGYLGGQDFHMVKKASILGSDEQPAWETVTIGCRPRAAHVSFTFENKLYFHGGYDPKSSRVFSELTEIDLLTDGFPTRILKYNAITPNVERRWHCCFLTERKFFVHGGWNAGGPLDDILCLDFNTMNWQKINLAGNSPRPRRWHSLVHFGLGQYLIFGGYNGDPKNPFGDTHMIDLIRGEWIAPSIKGQSPHPRYRHQFLKLSDKEFLLLGGTCSGSPESREIHILHTDEMKWSQLEPKIGKSLYPIKRSAHKAERVNEYGFVVLGGYTADYIHPLYYFDTRMLR